MKKYGHSNDQTVHAESEEQTEEIQRTSMKFGRRGTFEGDTNPPPGLRPEDRRDIIQGES